VVYLSTEEIDRLIKEDMPYFDLTSHLLGIKNQTGKISYFIREDAIVCGTEEVKEIFKKLEIECLSYIPSGERVNKNEVLISGTGKAENLHTAWKVGQNILDHCSGIATQTRKMTDIGNSMNPKVAVLTTRKGFPGTKSLAIKSVLAGGAFPHRLGISETVLIFKQHMNFIGGMEGLEKKISEIKQYCCEKKIIAEAESAAEGLKLTEMGVDGIQFDKLSIEELEEAVRKIREKNPKITLLAAGGINEKNISLYAKTGVDGIVTTSLYSAKPADVGVRLELL
jgi:molybdenum transport protein